MSRPVQTNSDKFRQVHTCPDMFSQTWPEIWALHNLACRSTVQRRKGRQTGNRKCHKELVLPPNISPFWAKPCDHRGQSNKPEHHSLHKKLEKREENCGLKVCENTYCTTKTRLRYRYQPKLFFPKPKPFFFFIFKKFKKTNLMFYHFLGNIFFKLENEPRIFKHNLKIFYLTAYLCFWYRLRYLLKILASLGFGPKPK